MNLFLRILVICSVIIIADFYFFMLLKQNFFSNKKKIQNLKIFCIIFPILFLLFELAIYFFVGLPEDNYIKYRQLFLVLDVFVLVYLPKSFAGAVLIIYDILKFIYRNILKFLNFKKIHSGSKIVYRIALALYFTVLAFAIYGFIYQKTDFKIQKIDICFNTLPKSFDGFTIVQISDLHLGSYTENKTFGLAVEMINDLKPDILFMTGDIINVSYKELLPYSPYFNSINPPYSKFSILGNHDIGDYFSLKHPVNQEILTQKLISTEKDVGFKLLVDTTYYIKKGKDSIAIIGINNCGTFPFKHSGDLHKAMKNTNKSDFKILLSHDPDEWENEIIHKTNIDLTLSGHTHAMQLALICGNLKLSPSALKYKYWYGLYNIGKQFLYVNPGLGYSAFSGRIGIRPEITFITLHHSN
jgi:uncharacterized protein